MPCPEDFLDLVLAIATNVLINGGDANQHRQPHQDIIGGRELFYRIRSRKNDYRSQEGRQTRW